jgi:nicotinate (nicotinamide) nucleotide adenylyltransferase
MKAAAPAIAIGGLVAMMLKRKIGAKDQTPDEVEFMKAVSDLFDLLDIDANVRRFVFPVYINRLQSQHTTQGSICIREAVAVLSRGGLSTEEIKRMISSLDKNEDGALSKSEFAAFCKDIPISALTSRVKTLLGKKRVAIMGGTFAPPTDSHLLMAANAIHLQLADEVWITPTGKPRSGDVKLGKVTLTSRDRLVMCHLAVDTSFSGSFPIKVCDEEIEGDALSTPELLRRLKKKHVNCHFSFLAGSNLCEKIPTWRCDSKDKNWWKDTEFIIFKRDAFDVPEDWAKSPNVTVADSGQSLLARRRKNLGQKPIPQAPTLSNMNSSVMKKRYQHKITAGLLPFAVENFMYRKQKLVQCLQDAATKKTKRRVAIFGGSFNPITDGHLKMACEVLHSKKVDELWLVPCGKRPDKPSLKTPALNRYLMCQLAVNSKLPMMNGGQDFAISVHDAELDAPKAYITPVLLRKLDKMYPEIEFCFVAGADLLEGMHTWGGDDQSLKGWELTRQMVVLPREGYEIPKNWKRTFLGFSLFFLSISFLTLLIYTRPRSQ